MILFFFLTKLRKELQKMWMVRQNPYQKTDSKSMFEFINKHKIITCPFAHTYEYSSIVENGEFSPIIRGWSAGGQDKKFIESIQIRDIVLIPFKKLNKIIIARVISSIQKPKLFTDLFTIKDKNGNVVEITSNPEFYQEYLQDYTIELNFCPIYRNIEILNIIDFDKLSYRFPPNSISPVKKAKDAILELI